MKQSEPDFFKNIRAELSSGRLWADRAVVLVCAVAAGLLVVGFTLASNLAFDLFQRIHGTNRWFALVWTPAVTALVVWLTRRYFPGAAGSGIPQVMAALDPELPSHERSRFVSLKLSFGKVGLAVAGLAGGLSIGREGPSVQVAAGVMQYAQRWLGPNTGISAHALLVAGGAAGIAATFNAPLAGVVFAIEELSRKLESHNSGLIIAAIVLAGLTGVSVFGNFTYFGVIQVPKLDFDVLLPGFMVAIGSGALGGLFSRVMTESLIGPHERLNRWRKRWPILFAAAAGLLIACIGLASGGATFGSGSDAVSHMLASQSDLPMLFALLKFFATWLTAWAGMPGGIFAPSLAIGAGIGNDVATLTGVVHAAPLIAMGMAGFLAAVTQAPLTAFIIVMEMVDGHSMVLTLMISAMLASVTSRLVSRPLYVALSEHMVQMVIAPPSEEPEPAEAEAGETADASADDPASALADAEVAVVPPTDRPAGG